MSAETIFSIVFLVVQLVFLAGTWGIMKCLEKVLAVLQQIYAVLLRIVDALEKIKNLLS